MEVIPTTKFGKRSLELIVIFVLFLVFTSGVVIGLFHQKAGDSAFDNLFITIPMLFAGFFALSAFVTGIIGVLKYKERSFVVSIPIIVGSIVSFFIFGELIFPH